MRAKSLRTFHLSSSLPSAPFLVRVHLSTGHSSQIEPLRLVAVEVVEAVGVAPGFITLFSVKKNRGVDGGLGY